MFAGSGEGGSSRGDLHSSVQSHLWNQHRRDECRQQGEGASATVEGVGLWHASCSHLLFWKRGSGRCTVSSGANCCVASPRPPSCRTQHKKQIAKFIVMGLLLNQSSPCVHHVPPFPFLGKTRPPCVPKGTQRPASISHCHGPISYGHWTHIVQPISHGNWTIDEERWLTFSLCTASQCSELSFVIVTVSSLYQQVEHLGTV